MLIAIESLFFIVGKHQGNLLSNQGGIMYKPPEIIYEGDLEVQAGSPAGLPVWDSTALDE